MRRIALLFLAGCSSASSWDPDRIGDAIRCWNSRSEPETLTRVDSIPVPDHPDLVAAICDYREEWDGFFGIYHLLNGAVDWQAEVDIAPIEQSIFKLRVSHLSGFSGPIIEVFGITHMGNGSLYLYELQGRRLRLLLETRAVDFNPDPVQFRDGWLKPAYRDLNGDGLPDLVLAGFLEDWGEKGDDLLRSIPCRRVFQWEAHQGRFVENGALREGFESSD